MNPLDLPDSLDKSENQFGAFVSLLPGESFEDALPFLNMQYARTMRHLIGKGLYPIGKRQIINHEAEDNVYSDGSGFLATSGWKQQFERRPTC